MLRIMLTGTLALTMLIAPTPQSDACIHGMRRNTDGNMRLLVKAERALRQGKYSRAFKLAKRSHNLPILKAGAKRSPFMLAQPASAKRAYRVLAIATVRLDGKTPLFGKQAKSDAQRQENLKWAIDRIQSNSKSRPNDVFLKTRLGEALATLDGRHLEALKILEDLAKEDLLADAHGYAALAKVLATEGDVYGHTAAIKRCKKMAAHKNICNVKPPQVAIAVP